MAPAFCWVGGFPSQGGNSDLISYEVEFVRSNCVWSKPPPQVCTQNCLWQSLPLFDLLPMITLIHRILTLSPHNWTQRPGWSWMSERLNKSCTFIVDTDLKYWIIELEIGSGSYCSYCAQSESRDFESDMFYLWFSCLGGWEWCLRKDLWHVSFAFQFTISQVTAFCNWICGNKHETLTVNHAWSDHIFIRDLCFILSFRNLVCDDVMALQWCKIKDQSTLPLSEPRLKKE